MNKLVRAYGNETSIDGDGWAEAAAEGSSQLQGSLLKFTNGRWVIGRENTSPENGLRLLALSVAAAWVKWESGKPRYVTRQPGTPFPDRDDLGDTDQSLWDLDDRNEPRDPWQNSRFVYLENRKTGEAYTFSTSSWGGRGAVTALGGAITRYRQAHPGASPLVTLESVQRETKRGHMVWSPVFKVVGWVDTDGEEIAPNRKPPQTLASAGAGRREDMDDEIPF